jgi:flagellar FliJ protein
MKRFRFRLEPLLRYREHLEQRARQEVAETQKKILLGEERIAGYERLYADTARELDDAATAGIDSKQYRHYTRYLEGIEASLDRERLQREEMLVRLSEKQEQLAQRAVDKKVLEELKNRRRDDYYRESMQTLQKEADDMIIVREHRSAVS